MVCGGSSTKDTGPRPATAAEFVRQLATRHSVGPTRDLTSDAEVRLSMDMATEMMEAGGTFPLADIAKEVYRDTDGACQPANIIIACKEAESRASLQQAWVPACHLTVVFPMYHEQNRILPGSQHPNGQNFVRNKVRQLDWLFAGLSGMSYDMIGVDDGCDKGSGDIMRGIVEEEHFGDRVRVAFLQEAIDQKIKVFSPLKTTADSRKGGAVLYGLHLAAAAPPDAATGKRHLVLFTDSDLSASVAMSGLVVAKILKDGAKFSSAARYGTPHSYLVTETGATGHPASSFQQPNVVHISVRQFVRALLLPDLAKMFDTNVGFKCWEVDDIPELLDGMSVFGPAFDMQLLLAGLRVYTNRLARGGGGGGGDGAEEPELIGVAPICFVEDFAESNFTSNSTNPDASAKGFQRMALEMCEMHKSFFAATNRTSTVQQLEWLSFIAMWDLEMYKRIIAGLEAERGRHLTLSEPYKIEDFMRWAGVEVQRPRLCSPKKTSGKKESSANL